MMTGTPVDSGSAGGARSPEQLAGWIATERLRLADFFDTLDPADWSRSSWWAGWTIRDVLAHLTVAPRTSPLQMILAMARSRGDFDRMTDRTARRRARTHDLATLIGQLRESAHSTARMPGSTPIDPFIDLLVHGQDVSRPLGRPLPMAADRALEALRHTIDTPFYTPPRLIEGLRLVADDADWQWGEVSSLTVGGPAGDLLLASCGRAGALERLRGTGVEVLRERLNDG